MYVVDTNVLVYAVSPAAAEHDQCRLALERWRRGATPWFLTWSIVYEFLRVTTHPRVLARPLRAAQALDVVDALFESRSLQVLVATPRHPQILASVVAEVPLLSGNLVHDAHIATLMREHGIRSIVTRDVAFHRFPFLEVVDPLM